MMDARAPFSEFTTAEIDVADILLHLPQLVFEPESRCRFWSWTAKRRRSSGRSLQSFVCFRLGHSSPSELSGGTDVGVVGPVCEREGAPVVKAEASSPATPLSFSPGSESDEKPKQLSKRKPPLKRVPVYCLFSLSQFLFMLFQFSSSVADCIVLGFLHLS